MEEDLAVTPLIESAAFKISMTTRNPYEAFKLVSAAQQVYLQSLRSDNNQVTQDRLQSLNKIVSSQERTVSDQSEALNAFRDRLNIPALTSRHAIELQTLQQINAELIKAASMERVTQLTLDTITKQAEDPEHFVLSSDMEEFIKEDPEMRTLQEHQARSWSRKRPRCSPGRARPSRSRIPSMPAATQSMRRSPR